MASWHENAFRIAGPLWRESASSGNSYGIIRTEEPILQLKLFIHWSAVDFEINISNNDSKDMIFTDQLSPTRYQNEI